MSTPPHRYYDQGRLEMADFLPATADRVLEVGCGTGAFLWAAKASLGASEAWGVEPVEAAAASAIARGCTVVTGRFPDCASEIDGCFDSIVFNDVLEHLVDPWAALRAARELLSDHGSVTVSLPNVANLLTLVHLVKHGDFRYREKGVLDRTHLRFFTRRSAERMFAECGFEVAAFAPITPLHGLRLRVVAGGAALLPWVGAKELGFVQMAFRLVRAT